MVTYTNPDMVTDTRVTVEPNYGRTVSGYGGKVPTRFMVRYAGRWHRVHSAWWRGSSVGYGYRVPCARDGGSMTPNLWTVTLRADGGTYRHLIVSGATEDDATVAACNIELAPKRSVVKVEAYRETN